MFSLGCILCSAYKSDLILRLVLYLTWSARISISRAGLFSTGVRAGV